MFSPFSTKTQSSSQAFNPFASRPAGEGASFGLDGAGDSKWGKRNKRNSRLPENSDSDVKIKANNPFKGKDANLSDGGKQRKKRGGDGDRTGTEPRKNARTMRDGAKNLRHHQNGHGLNGLHYASSTGEDDELRPTSSSSATSAGGESDPSSRSTDPFAKKVYDRLRKDGISPPSWPSQPGNPRHKTEMSKFREKYEEYRKKVRASLTKAGLIDDPHKRKTLQDAIEFRGICEDMCPEYEKITRITELDVPQHEKDTKTTFVNAGRMVKKLARSAAGQEAPLPMDVRSTASLRRTLDYLIDDLLRNDENLPALHGFLWDRTRAIRRDFTFFSSPTVEDLKTQAYVFENIARFHVTSLHLLSQPGKAGEDFVEQQELEQLGKALLSLRDLYDDCNAQGVVCENEAEFRAYYLVFHAYDPNVIEMLQRQWKSELWKDSDDIRTAVLLVEALQNTVDSHGPLTAAPSLAASSTFNAYFRIIEDADISYTMACFAECHFPQLRRSILRAVRRAMARPKDTANDVTAAKLKQFLRFDTIQEAIDFAKFHDMEFVPDQQAPTDPSRQFLVLNNKGLLPRPRLPHQFSQSLVENKRGKRPLPDVIHRTLYEDSDSQPSKLGTNGSYLAAEESLFVRDSDSEAPIPPNPAEMKTSAASPFASFGQTPSGLGSNLAGNLGGGHQAPASSPIVFGATQSQLPATESSPFGRTSTPSGNAAAASSLFAPATSSSNNTPMNPFAPVSISSAAATKPFGQPSPTASLTGFQGFQSKEPTKPQQLQPAISAAEKPSPFPSVLQLGTNGNTLAKNPFAAAETPGESKPVNVAPSPFAANIKTSSESRLATPNEVASGTKDGAWAPPGGYPRPSLPEPASSTDNSGQALGIGSATLPTEPALPGFGIGGTPPTGPALPNFDNGGTAQSFPSFRKAITSPFSLPGSRTTADAKLGSPLPDSLLVAEKKSVTQPFAQTLGGVTTPQPPSSTGLGLGTPSTLNLYGSDSSTAAADTSSQLPKPSPAVVSPPRDLLGDFTKWFVQGDNGLMHDFEIFLLDNILHGVYDKFQKDKEEKRRREEEELNNAEAKRFRVYNLSLKYFYRWKVNAREKRLKHLRRSGREQLRAFHEAQRAAHLKEEQEAAQRAAEKRAELAALNRPEELATIIRSSKRGKRKAEEALLESGVLSGVGNEREAITMIVRERHFSPRPVANGGQGTHSRSGSIASTKEGTKTRALREELLGRKPGRFRRSLPSMSSGESSNSERTPRVSKVSERWRLKAMGIVQMPDGTALPELMADEIRRGFRKDMASARSTPTRRASIAGATRNKSRLALSAAAEDATTASAGDDSSASITNKRKRPTEDDGGASEMTSRKRTTSDAEKLINELRAMREEMAEGTMWLKEQNGRLQSDILSRGGTPLDEGSI